ncbi:MAG TPA: hypothetical protein VK447_07120 [Myxococcaceae bacterium]|nr:hypothetical protein [Myxococcaceae bacterium]
MTKRILSILILASALPACRDLEYRWPTTDGDGGANPGPTITFVTPHENEQVTLSQYFVLEVEDLNGVKRVQLSCDGQLLRWWEAEGPTYQDAVNLSPCRASSPRPDGGSTDGGPTDGGPGDGGRPDGGAADGGPQLRTVTVLAEAWDTRDRKSSRSITLRLDTTMAAVAVVAPARVLPGAQIPISITSDQELVAPPQVTVDGVLVSTTPVAGQGLRAFTTTVVAPALGIDRYNGDAGMDVPLEVLSEVERTVTVEVDATTSSGFTTHQEARVLVSRIVWQATLPSQAVWYPYAARAVAPDGGLQVGLQVSGSPGEPTAWLPVFVDAKDGALTPFTYETTDLQAMSARGFTAKGETLLLGVGRSFAHALLEPRTNRVLDRGTGTYSNDPQLLLTRFGDRICQEALSPTGNCTVTQRRLTCSTTAGTGVVATLANPAGDDSVSPSRLALSSGNTYLGANNNPFCTNALQLFAVPAGSNGKVAQLSGFGPARLLPHGDGTFILSAENNTTTFVQETLLVDGQGNVINSYTPNVPAELVSAWRDVSNPSVRNLLRVRALPPYTLFEAYQPAATSPNPASRLYGLFIPDTRIPPTSNPDGGVRSLTEYPVNVVQRSTGETALLAYSSANVVSLVTFDAGLRPRWIYRLPPVLRNTLQLTFNEADRRLYLVDDHNVVTAFQW